MSRTTTHTIRKWVTVIVLLVFVASLAIWLLRRDTLPWTTRIATGKEGGLYYKLGSELQPPLAKELRRRVEIIATAGSEENIQRLLSGDVDLTIVQGGSAPVDNVSVVTPLFPELVLIIVRKTSNIEKIRDLTGHNVSLGPVGSGNRRSALQVLDHFAIDASTLGKNDLYFGNLRDDPSLEAAIVTAGIGHPDLDSVLGTGKFDLLPINNSAAVDMLYPFLRSSVVPQGLFAEDPPVPAQQMSTISTTAFLVTRDDAPDKLVSAALASVHEMNLRLEIPTLITRQDAPSRVPGRLHPVAQRYFNPSDNIGYMANVMESLAATKELLFALCAGGYLLWLRWRRLKERETQELISRQKEHLDKLLEETLRIEQAQLQTDETEALRSLLDSVTHIKIRALQEFTEEELRGDQTFNIFLSQCSNVINKMQLKIIWLESRSPTAE